MALHERIVKAPGRFGGLAGLVVAVVAAVVAPARPSFAVVPGDDAVLRAEVGAVAPTVVLPDLTGRPRSLTEFRGHRVMLHVFASW